MATQDRQQKSTGEPQDFGSTMQRLESLVEQLEAGELSLEDSLKAFEQGVALARDAQRRLDEAELKVRQLTESEEGGMELTPFGAAAENHGER
ncbi:exodeoxyribonuclease VII small subunit [Halomonas cupida]|uniref:Exodeoxyribonuclease 7 small subunit n=1 Tax=Halomonas cupida TaxID=44933 RepID=A0A1M7MLP8_9GAMM|nr:exodeoxyribonuclease VII small subunit [Halomonas cupida]GEN26118.1 exodeoxyribonuclease 7 small subunit [Halomonas cupida]SHM91859.1 Exodeoxyribonuclease VII small subunit [Halomonas cupida]